MVMSSGSFIASVDRTMTTGEHKNLIFVICKTKAR
jgi:hypothetical protein